jgi:hypothetical protein
MISLSSFKGASILLLELLSLSLILSPAVSAKEINPPPFAGYSESTDTLFNLDEEIQKQVGNSLGFLPFQFKDVSLLLMSAFYDLRPLQVQQSAAIRIVALTTALPNSATFGKLACEWKDQYGELHVSRTITSFQLADEDFHKRTWKSTGLSCAVPDVNFTPISLRVISDTEKSVWIEVTQMPEVISNVLQRFGQIPEENYNDHFKHQMSICLAPVRVHEPADERFVNLFIQWMEFYKLMGVSKFYVYDLHLTPNSRKIIESYVKDGYVELIPFPLPPCTVVEAYNLTVGSSKCDEGNVFEYVHYFAQIAASFDCLLRTVGSSRWTAFVDFDEFIIPRSEKFQNLSSFFDGVMNEFQVNHSELTGFQFNNHHSDSCSIAGPLDTAELNTMKYAAVLHQARQIDNTCSYGERSKNVVNAMLVEWVGVHHLAGPFFKKEDPSVSMLQKINGIRRSAVEKRGRIFSRWGQAGTQLDNHVYYVPPEEATMFHFKGKEFHTDNSTYCEKLYNSSYIRDSIIWDKLGPKLLEAVTSQHEKMN